MIRLPSGSVIGLLALLVAAGAATAVVVAVPTEPPAVLRTATAPVSVRVTTREDVDERQVQVALDVGAPRAVTTTRSGTVTASTCTVGGTIRSGDVIAQVDGVPVIALASAVPLWRDLEIGDSGDDVRGLQRELARLGAPLNVDGLMGRATVRATRHFLKARGVPRADLADDAVSRAPFSWVPATDNTVQTCTAIVGARLDDGRIAELPAELLAARVQTPPVDPAPGERVLRLGGLTVPVGADGVVKDRRALAEVEALPEYTATVSTADGTPALGAEWALRRARTVHVVPPTALVDVRGGRACLQPLDGPAILVDVLGSELGQSFVQPVDDTSLDRVRAAPPRSTTCR